jgi:ATP-binding cassette subfamily B protein
MTGNRNIFSVAVKSIGLAWRTNKTLFLALLLLNVFQGSIVYLQFTSFSSIVDEIIRIKQGLANYDGLIRYSVILGVAFLVPTLLSNAVNYFRARFRLELDMQLDLYPSTSKASWV